MKESSFRFIYTTDLHGNTLRYQIVLEYALEHNIKLIHLGADILPKGSLIQKRQKKFISGFLKKYYRQCGEKGIKLLTFFGNDDLYSGKKSFRKYGSLLDEKPEEIENFTFKAYGYVCDHHFGLKNGCKWDYAGFKSPEVKPFTTYIVYDGIKIPIKSTPPLRDENLEIIKDLEKYFENQSTIEEDLKSIHADNRTIMAMHMPPHSLELDVCDDGRRVGSKSVFNWIVEEEPLLFLSGHIHESPKVSGVWKVMVGKTLVIQPGQEVDKVTLVDIEIDRKGIEAQLVYLEI